MSARRLDAQVKGALFLFLTADDVIEIVGDPPPPADPRAWGPLIRSACLKGWIAPQGLTKSRRASCQPTRRGSMPWNRLPSRVRPAPASYL
jgi:hypothetical protein